MLRVQLDVPIVLELRDGSRPFAKEVSAAVRRRRRVAHTVGAIGLLVAIPRDVLNAIVWIRIDKAVALACEHYVDAHRVVVAQIIHVAAVIVARRAWRKLIALTVVNRRVESIGAVAVSIVAHPNDPVSWSDDVAEERYLVSCLVHNSGDVFDPVNVAGAWRHTELDKWRWHRRRGRRWRRGRRCRWRLWRWRCRRRGRWRRWWRRQRRRR